MRRKDGEPKRKALKSMPDFRHGFRENPATGDYRHPIWAGPGPPGHHSVVSLFAGCGGLDLGVSGGFRHLGATYTVLPFDVVCAIDNDQDAIAAYRLNLSEHGTLGDLTVLNVDGLPCADVLMGGFPCQDFSSSGPKVGFAGKRGQLYQVLTDYMAHHQPKIVIGENVPHLERLHGGIYLQTILRDFEGQGYRFDVWDLYGPNYGLPQSRRRLFLIGVRNDLVGYPVRPKSTHLGRRITIDAALADLEEIIDEAVPNQSQYSRRVTGHCWRRPRRSHQPRRTCWYCIRANSRGRIQFHYKLDRRLTVRECARLQAFPDEFVFPFSAQRNLTLVGNAVPPILAHTVATSIADFLAQTSTAQADNLAESASKTRNRTEQLALFGGSSAGHPR